MLRRYTKLLAIAGIILGLGTANGDTMAANSDGELPIRVVTVTVAQGTRGQFFDQLRKYADTYAFAIRIAPNHPDGEHFLIQLWREDIKIIGGTSPFGPPQFDIAFYQNGDEAIPVEMVDEMVSGLERALTDVQGVTVLKAK